MTPRIFLIGLFVLCASCTRRAPRETTPAFYYWKQTWTGNATERQYAQQLPAKRLYIKMFDVAADEAAKKPVPVAIFRKTAPLPVNIEIVPVIFLANEIWKYPDTSLATKVARLLQQLCDSFPAASIREIQLDCDWTRSSRAAYFAFMQQIRQTPFFRQRRLSATIRMYQLKYAVKTGIPPADRGLLMCYNMGDLRRPGPHNSILDEDAMASYLGENRVAAYPLPLDVALPLFEWSVLFRNGVTYAGILRNVGDAELRDTAFFERNAAHLYTVRKDTLLKGYFLQKGSVIRRETVNHAALERAARMVAKQLQTNNPVVVFYHLDAATLQKYPLDELQKIYRFFN